MKNLDPKTHAKWLVMFWVLSVGALIGLSLAFFCPDQHPLIFALSLSWVIAVVVSGVTRNFFRGLNPRRFGFASWEREGEIYGRFGLNTFLWLLKRTPLGWLNPWLRLTLYRSGLEPLLREMFYAEGAHWIGGVVTLGFGAACVFWGHAVVGLLLAVVTIPFHVYPVMLQRRNRGRVLRLSWRFNAFTNRSSRQVPALSSEQIKIGIL
jgi:hypothetical protein